MRSREYLDDQDAEEPDDFIISLIAQVSILYSTFLKPREQGKGQCQGSSGYQNIKNIAKREK